MKKKINNYCCTLKVKTPLYNCKYKQNKTKQKTIEMKENNKENCESKVGERNIQILIKLMIDKLN